MAVVRSSQKKFCIFLDTDVSFLQKKAQLSTYSRISKYSSHSTAKGKSLEQLNCFQAATYKYNSKTQTLLYN